MRTDTTMQAREAKSMAPVTYIEAIRQALLEEMRRDQNVFCIGEDIGNEPRYTRINDLKYRILLGRI